MKKWPTQWITAATDALREQWTMHYAPEAIVPTATSTDDTDSIFAAIDNFGKTLSTDELDEYLNTTAIGHVVDPITWWSRMDETPLAQMALDFLSAPGMYIVVYSVILLNFY
jgi:hypothetical protein